MSLKRAKVELGPLLQRMQAPSLGSYHMVFVLHRRQELKFGNLRLDIEDVWKYLDIQADVCCRSGTLMENLY